MTVPFWVWVATIGALLLLLCVDFLVAVRRPHEVSVKEASLWTVFYVALAVAFGLAMIPLWGPQRGGEFFAGWLTEYSLSVDNLFVFVIIMARFAVPRAYQQRVLLIGIVLALVMRGIFIAAGAAAINRFSWVFYIFGAFLIYTAVKLSSSGQSDESDFKENVFLRLMERVLPTTRDYVGTKVVTRIRGRLRVTPMLIVMLAIGSTDLLFALDSIPAIFGLTREPYIVFTANLFALMGLRQLYFLVGGLLDRLVYLGIGLSVILGFIGVKLVLEAVHENSLPFVNGGEPVEWVPELPIWVSLGVIVGTLAVTTVLSLLSDRRAAKVAAAAAEAEQAPETADASETADTRTRG